MQPAHGPQSTGEQPSLALVPFVYRPEFVESRPGFPPIIHYNVRFTTLYGKQKRGTSAQST